MTPKIPRQLISCSKRRGAYFSGNCCHFDFPAILTARVKARYLIPAYRNLEAGIRIDDLKFLKDAKITLHLDPETTDIHELGNLPTQQYQKKIVCFNKLISKAIRNRLIAFNAGEKHTTKTIMIRSKFPSQDQVFKKLFLNQIAICMKELDEHRRLCRLRTFCYELFQISTRSPTCRTELFGAFTEKSAKSVKISQVIEKYINSFADYPTFNPEKRKCKKSEYWGKCFGIAPTTMVEVTHGGGLNYLLDCFEGNENGYRLERGIGVGIQVHPHVPPHYTNTLRDRIFYYSRRVPLSHFDFPATLTGKVAAKHLLPANNSYEVGIRVGNLKHIIDAKITLHLDPETTDIHKLGNLPTQQYQKKIVSFNRWISDELKKRQKAFNEKSSD